VLVSDGYPQGCNSTDDKIETVVAAVKKVSKDISTYVIGVANPPGGPDTVTNLNDIAAAGGSDKAFIIQTGDPEKNDQRLPCRASESSEHRSYRATSKFPPPPGRAIVRIREGPT